MSSPSGLFFAAALIFIMIVSGMRHHNRQRNGMKRSKQILDRYNPERSMHPLGL